MSPDSQVREDHRPRKYSGSRRHSRHNLSTPNIAIHQKNSFSKNFIPLQDSDPIAPRMHAPVFICAWSVLVSGQIPEGHFGFRRNSDVRRKLDIMAIITGNRRHHLLGNVYQHKRQCPPETPRLINPDPQNLHIVNDQHHQISLIRGQRASPMREPSAFPRTSKKTDAHRTK